MLDETLRQYRDIEKDEFIVVGVDTAAGGADYCAAQFISADRLDVPLVYHEKTLATNATPKILTLLEKIHDITGVKPVVAFERNNGGVFEMERLASLNKNQKFKTFEMYTYGKRKNDQPRKLGWDTNSATRPKMLSDLKDAVDNRLIHIYDYKTVQEMFSFVTVQTSTAWRAQAEKGSHDDLLMSLAIAWQLYHREKKPAPSVRKRIVSLNKIRSKKWGIG